MQQSPEQDLLAYDEEARSRGRAWALDLLRTWGPAFLLIIVARASLVAPFQIPSGSMVPTLEIGDHILVSRFAYGLQVPWIGPRGAGPLGLPVGAREVVRWGAPERGDVIVFKYPPDPRDDYVKRVVAVPGDTVAIRGDQIVLNGAPIAREPDDAHVFTDAACRDRELPRYRESLGEAPHAILDTDGVTDDVAPLTVPDDHFFVMGDNRDNSSDSRAWGLVPRENLVGEAFLVWMSRDTCGDAGPLGGFREGRAGTRLE